MIRLRSNPRENLSLEYKVQIRFNSKVIRIAQIFFKYFTKYIKLYKIYN